MTPTDLVRQFYEKLGQGDAPGLLGLFAEEISWTEDGALSLFQRHMDAVRWQIAENLLAPLGRDWENFCHRWRVGRGFVQYTDTALFLEAMR